MIDLTPYLLTNSISIACAFSFFLLCISGYCAYIHALFDVLPRLEPKIFMNLSLMCTRVAVVFFFKVQSDLFVSLPVLLYCSRIELKGVR